MKRNRKRENLKKRVNANFDEYVEEYEHEYEYEFECGYGYDEYEYEYGRI